MFRDENFKQHYQLIDSANKLSFNDLCEELASLEPLEVGSGEIDEIFERLPRKENDNNIFLALLTNPKISPKQMIDLFSILYDQLGYGVFNDLLFTGSMAAVILKNPQHEQLMINCYLYNLEYGFNDRINKVIERQIWQRVIKNQNSKELTDIILKLHSLWMPAKALDFRIMWLQSAESQEAVIRIYKTIHSLGLNKKNGYTDEEQFLLKTAKQYVLKFEFENAKKIPRLSKSEVVSFLSSSLSFFGKFHNTQSIKIYKKIQKDNFLSAENDFENADKQYKDAFSHKNNYQIMTKPISFK